MVGAGLQPGQVILKVNGSSVNHSDHQEVLDHFTARHALQETHEAVRERDTHTSRNIHTHTREHTLFDVDVQSGGLPPSIDR